MNSLITNGIVDMYPPLNDVEGSYTAQFEHVRLLFPLVLGSIVHGQWLILIWKDGPDTFRGQGSD